MDLKTRIASIPGFPKEGIIFRDITPILADPEALAQTATEIGNFAKEVNADVIVAPEARGFMFGIPAAMDAKIPFIPVRKPGKLRVVPLRKHTRSNTAKIPCRCMRKISNREAAF
ncbi:hypothetical protein [Allobaculum sp. Allo2]|uniref:hypothetical protein n=1 Tax=Allobaculum sp. Allo2 TaxID=2853432 RepID=UPI001F61457C|nr:hypothetical protein [Allobaculum sp. Allo2]